ncbi:PA14 domain-containing protein [Gilvimarinus algae]|uniref:PA14 domain-containing protein n=1 Tax=Gilvimarinus algae TaxID=3058037 RepID=A0ABT8TKL3_9GAMM|nr:PA14 domain-containing protein [Gilvimarinus sp. SDUM040014]MDO3382902.1 PA14 domain-containing protein [Gilvimarinus sp. SDUM040014]
MTKNSLLSLLLIGFAVLVVIRLIPPSVDEILEMTLSKNAENITAITQARNITETRTLMIDKVELNHNNRFGHSVLGPLGWSEHFFADIETRFRVAEKARYRFMVGSDDGFRLSIDGKLLCQHVKDRPFRKQSCYQTLEEGEYQLSLSYFQGYGNAGLTLEAGRDSGDKPVFWGDAIAGIEYLPVSGKP